MEKKSSRLTNFPTRLSSIDPFDTDPRESARLLQEAKQILRDMQEEANHLNDTPKTAGQTTSHSINSNSLNPAALQLAENGEFQLGQFVPLSPRNYSQLAQTLYTRVPKDNTNQKPKPEIIAPMSPEELESFSNFKP